MSFDHAQAARFVGAESGVLVAADKVSKSDIRHWCEVIGDPDPAYGEQIKRGAKTAPPAMLMVWSVDPLWPSRQHAVEPHEKVFELLESAGYAGTLMIALEQEFLGSARIGDRLRFTIRVEEVSRSEEKTTLGWGHVVHLRYTFLDGAGEVVSRQKCSVLKFRMLDLKR